MVSIDFIYLYIFLLYLTTKKGKIVKNKIDFYFLYKNYKKMLKIKIIKNVKNKN